MVANENSNKPYQKISAKRGVFKIQSKMTNAGESFELLFCDNCVATFQEQGVKELMVVLADLQEQHHKREKNS